MTSKLAVTALRMAIILRGRPAGTVVHSDRGGQFRSKKNVMVLRNKGAIGSMGPVSSAGDKAAITMNKRNFVGLYLYSIEPSATRANQMCA